MNPETPNHETARSASNPGQYVFSDDSPDAVGFDSTKADSTSAHSGSEQDRLQWLAFCYVADELTADQVADFEGRLATDLKAQEALASAVELSSGVYGHYQLEAASADGSKRLDLAGSRNNSADRSSILSRVLLLAAAVLVMAFIAHGLVQDGNQSTAHNRFNNQTSSSQLSILADSWINSLDVNEVETTDSDELSEWNSEDFDESSPLIDSSRDGDDLGVDANLISFYSEMLDSDQEESLLNSDLPNQKAGVEL